MRTFKSIVFSVCLLLILSVFCSCGEESLSKTDYASAVVTIYGDYCDKFDEISEALQKGQRVTANTLCDEATEIMDAMIELAPPTAFKDEHEDIVGYCENEKEKLSLQKEYLEIAKDAENLTEEQKTRITELQERLSILSLQSDKLEIKVAEIAGKQLETQTEEHDHDHHGVVNDDWETQ